MIKHAKEKIILAGIILGSLLTSASCGPQERDNALNIMESESTVEYSEETGPGDKETAAAEILSSLTETVSENPAEEDSIDRSGLHDSVEECLADLDIHPLYKAFLYNEISVPNPFVPGGKLSFFDDRDYAQEEYVFEYAAKCFALVDVNGDGVPELIFRIYSSPDELMYILGIQEDRLVCYDVQETHTSRMSFEIYDNGIVTWGQDYDGVEAVYYSYNRDGSPRELIHFVREEADTDSGLCYDYYYMDGDETARCSLQSDEEYEALISPYKGGEPEWFSCDSFADIPRE